MQHTRKEQMEAFGRFLDILDELREKCPWDRKQTDARRQAGHLQGAGRRPAARGLLRQDRQRDGRLRHQGRVRPPVREAHLPSSARLRQ